MKITVLFVICNFFVFYICFSQHMSFSIIGLQKVENEPIIFSETYVGSKKFEETNRIDFLKAQKKYLMKINDYIQMETGIDLSMGQPEKIMRYNLIERDYK